MNIEKRGTVRLSRILFLCHAVRTNVVGTMPALSDL
jgi:hypothetical protein